jgi:hypothetical protein
MSSLFSRREKWFLGSGQYALGIRDGERQAERRARFADAGLAIDAGQRLSKVVVLAPKVGIVIDR